MMPSHTTPSLYQREVTESCPGFHGNPNLYGFGIRLGVYFMWLSSWLTNTFNPSAAAANHDANSIFLLALLIGISVAESDHKFRAIEAYLMLHICFGFTFTVLSLLGVRVYFYTPSTLSEFLCHLRRQQEKLKGSVRERIRAVQTAFRQFREWLRSRNADDDGERKQQEQQDEPTDAIGQNTIFSKLVRNLRQTHDASLPSSTLGLVRAATFEFTSDTVSFLKHPSLSWSGVAWRGAIFCYLSALNMWFWWSPRLTSYTAPDSGRVCAPTIFFFGNRHIDGGLLVFFRGVSIAMAIPALWLCWIILSTASAMWKFVFGFLARWAVVTSLGPETWDGLHAGTKLAVGLLLTPFMLWDNIWPYVVIDGFLGSPVLLQGVFAFWNIESSQLPEWSELWMPFISFMSRGVDLMGGPAEWERQVRERKQSSVPRAVTALCVAFQAVNLATIACFIVFIERTISVGEISDVYGLRSTGQLIPLVIGLASFAASLREIALLHLRKNSPKWHEHKFKIRFGLGPCFCEPSPKEDPTGTVDSNVCTPQSMLQNPTGGGVSPRSSTSKHKRHGTKEMV